MSVWVTQNLMIFALVADISILTLNLSLMINTVSFYQIAKLLIIPFVCLIERFYMGRTFSNEVLATIGLVVVGVAVVTVEDLQLDISAFGALIAGVSVVSSGLQQIFVRTMQQKHKLSSYELLSKTAPAQAWTLLLMGPFVDKVVSGTWVFQYQPYYGAMFCLAASCLLAVLVNVSQFMCLGRFSAVLGHSKTIIVLLGGWLFLGDELSTRKLLGMTLAVSGMIWYGKATTSVAPQSAVRKSPSPRAMAGTLEERKALLGAVHSHSPADAHVSLTSSTGKLRGEV
ncbi:hypothetical protein QBZ16_000900 [Prototheca wickerhamii]|uniref:Sugar phosphate transporter domain-containing protein n=1 Tax=Prototheca wickerhamii TaxID=3111 RepID=A0AAD9IFR5_PROWI|nr:hypothetical protein QBZ16_000900 [Prototheca wickerhamii]